jgi:cell division protein FtsB
MHGASIGANSLEAGSRLSYGGADSCPAPPMSRTEALRSTLPLILFAILAGSAAWACFGDRGLLANRRLEAELATRTAQLDERRRTIDRLKREIDAMRTDPAVQERWIRQELSYVRKGELLYLFPGDRAADFTPLSSPPEAP